MEASSTLQTGYIDGLEKLIALGSPLLPVGEANRELVRLHAQLIRKQAKLDELQMILEAACQP